MQNQKYALSVRIVHWAMATIIIGLLGLGFYMEYFLAGDSPFRGQIYYLHKSFGALVLFFIAYRIFLKLTNKAPELPKTINKLSQRLAFFTHMALYLLMIMMPLSGYLMSNSFGHPVHLFFIELPNLVSKNIELGKLFGDIHEILGYSFAFIITLHIAGALKHRFFDLPDNDVLKRIT
jgi:cytochrome b561